jgi:hypothetical protein
MTDVEAVIDPMDRCVAEVVGIEQATLEHDGSTESGEV